MGRDFARNPKTWVTFFMKKPLTIRADFQNYANPGKFQKNCVFCRKKWVPFFGQMLGYEYIVFLEILPLNMGTL